MKFITGSYDINTIPDATNHDAVLRHLETIGRNCYKSNDKITADSAAGFMQRLRNNKHWAMLEHFVFVMYIPEWIYKSLIRYDQYEPRMFEYHRQLKYLELSYDSTASNPMNRYILSGSATTFNYLWQCDCVRRNSTMGITHVCRFLKARFPELIMVGSKDDPDSDMSKYWDMTYDPSIKLLTREEIVNLPDDIRYIHDWMSVKFILDRSCTHDLVRHRPVSYAQESTRYVNYDNKGYTCLIPYFFTVPSRMILKEYTGSVERGYRTKKDQNIYEKLSDQERDWLDTVEDSFKKYSKMIQTYHMTPEDSMSLLPHCTAAVIHITARKYEWKHIFNMRADTHARRQIQAVMVPLLNQCIHEDPMFFNDQQYLVQEGVQYV